MSDILCIDKRFNLRISPYITEDALTTALRQAKVFLYDFEYVKDAHFERYVLGGLDTMEKVNAFLDSLDLGKARRGGFAGSGSPSCIKARQVRAWLAKGFCAWMEPARAAQAALSSARRTNCACHQKCSFAPRPAWDTVPRGQKRRASTKSVDGTTIHEIVCS